MIFGQWKLRSEFFEHPFEVGVRFHPIQLAGANQAGHHLPDLATKLGPGEQGNLAEQR